MFPQPNQKCVAAREWKLKSLPLPRRMLWQDFSTRFPPTSVALSTLFQRGLKRLPLFSHLQGREHRNCRVSIGGSFQASRVENTGTPAVGPLREWQDDCWRKSDK